LSKDPGQFKDNGDEFGCEPTSRMLSTTSTGLSSGAIRAAHWQLALATVVVVLGSKKYDVNFIMSKDDLYFLQTSTIDPSTSRRR
jgi:hypothetical protein